MKTRVILPLLTILLIVFLVWLGFRREIPQLSSTVPKTHSEVVTKVSTRAVVSLAPPSEDLALAETWRLFEISLDKPALDRAVATGDANKWRPIMGQARHFNVRRENGIALLLTYLDHRNAQVRAAAAQYLFEIGSRAGGPVLIRLLEDIAGGERHDVDPVNAAAVLHQYRYPVDGDLIYRTYQKTGSTRLLMYAQLLGSLQSIPEAKSRLRSHGLNDGALMGAGIMRLNDLESIELYNINFKSSDLLRREYAAAAIYRATGNSEYLDYLIAIAEAKVGLRARAGISNDAAEAFRVLQQIVVPETTEALLRIEAAARKNRHEVEANLALLGLYYFHHAYDYVDTVILAQFAGKLPEGLLIGSIWELAAARGTPEIRAAAKAYNQEAYDREFLRKAGRPVESWVFQYIWPEIPSYVRPALKG